MAEFEFAGTTFRGGKMFAILTALSTLGGGAWAGFEFYKDYMDMKEIIQEIDIDAIQLPGDTIDPKFLELPELLCQSISGGTASYSREFFNAVLPFDGSVLSKALSEAI